MRPTGDNLFRALPAALPEELFTVLATGDGVRIERIVSRGQASPPGYWYDQDQHEFVLVVSGWAQVQIAGEATPRALQAGDHLLLPAHCRHRVAATAADQDTVWLAVFFR